MTLEEMGEKAARLMIKRFHCSQAVLAVGQEKLGRPDDEVIRAMGAFGGGLGGNGEVCGAVVGALAVIGLKFSRGREEEKEDPKMWDYAHELLERFREEIVKKHGNITCAAIAGVDWKDRAQVKAFYAGEKVLECRRIVADTAKLVGELLEQAS
jgi:C_GCAxxG_C_C family probable redox protein